MDEERLDLRCLDPFPDPQAFDRETARLTADILALRALNISYWQALYHRARTAALCAAAAAGVVMALLAFYPLETAQPPPHGPEYTLLTWTALDHSPSTEEILNLIGDAP